jgi:hypothetical protein
MELDFNRKRVLVLEDNGITAAELSYSLEAANAVVIGPFAQLEDAEDWVMYTQLAVLDIDIRGRSSFGIADHLGRLDIPYIFFSGLDRARLPVRFAGIDCVSKMTSPMVALHQLSSLSCAADQPQIIDLIPALRRRARRYLSDPLAADRLVERTLQLALEDGQPPGMREVELWLRDLMERALQAGSAQFLN